MDKTRPQTVITAMLLALLLVATLQGCLSSHGNEYSGGIITGQYRPAANLQLIARSDSGETAFPVDAEGRFSARLSSGIYNLYLQSADGNISLIRSGVEVSNNMTVSVLDTDIVPIPQVTSVAVPLVDSTSAIVEWQTDIESDGYIEFGNNELYGYLSYAVTELKTRHRIQLYNLLPSTTYHFRVVASRYNLESTRSFSRNFTFTTEP